MTWSFALRYFDIIAMTGSLVFRYFIMWQGRTVHIFYNSDHDMYADIFYGGLAMVGS